MCGLQSDKSNLQFKQLKISRCQRNRKTHCTDCPLPHSMVRWQHVRLAGRHCLIGLHWVELIVQLHRMRRMPDAVVDWMECRRPMPTCLSTNHRSGKQWHFFCLLSMGNHTCILNWSISKSNSVQMDCRSLYTMNMPPRQSSTVAPLSAIAPVVAKWTDIFANQQQLFLDLYGME